MKLPGNLYRDEDIAAACAERLSAKIDNATVSRDHERMRCGNSAGLGILERQDDLIRRIGALENTTISLQEYVTSDAYFAVRNRWISNFVKNKRKDRLSPMDDEIIKSGDTAAHHGDPYIDALLYKDSKRTDMTIYKALYGFRYKEVLENLSSESEGDQKALRVLAKHATVKADTKLKSVPKTFSHSFDVFLDRLDSGGWRTEQLLVESAPEAQLYRAFQREFDAIKGSLHKWKG